MLLIAGCYCPATVGLVHVGAFKIGDTAGTIDNI